jgi:ferric-dicitrate binding protein FerR (iron transport regulator)
MTAPGRSANGGAAAFARLSEIVRSIASGDVGEEASLAGRERFLSAVGRRRWRPGVAGVVLGGATVLAAGAAAARLLQPPSACGGSSMPGNGYVSGKQGASPTVRFASGSSVEFAASGRGRVGDLKAARPRVVLEGGHATIHSEAHPPQDLLVEAGPYALKSGGAAFDVSWSGSVLEVRVASGAVTVEGPVVREGLTLHEDQAFVARESDGEVRCF